MLTPDVQADGKVAGATYPEVMVSYVALNSIHKSTDVARVKFEDAFRSWSFASDFDLPENASDVIDLCPAVSAYGPGYFALYRIQNQPRLVFLTTQKVSGFPFEVALACPPGATAIRTYRETGRRGLSGVLVGGDGLHHWASNEYLRAGQPGRLISAPGAFVQVVQLDVAQSQGGMLSVFAETKQHGLSYARVPPSNATFSTPLTSISLVPDGLGGAYSPFIDPEGLTQQVIVASKTGTLTLLSQDQATGYWQSSPFYVPDPDKVIEYSGYMTRVVFTGPRKGTNTDVQVPLADRPVVMRYPVYTDVLVNGRSVTIGPSGTTVLTDARGVLSYLIPSSGIATDFVTLENPGGGDPDIVPAPLEIDPTQKVFDKLATLETAEGLQNATLPNGNKLLAGSTASAGDIERYAKALKAMGEERRKIKAAGPARAVGASRGLVERSLKRETIACSAGWSGANRNLDVVSSSFNKAAARDNIFQDGLEFLQDVVGAIGDGIQWALERVEDRLELWIERTDRPGLRIFLETLLDITEAISLVFHIVFEVIDEFFEFLITFFDFEAWAVAKRYIASLTNGALDVAEIAIDKAQDSVSAFFDQMDEQLKDLIFPPELDGLGIFELFTDSRERSKSRAAVAVGAQETETKDSSVQSNAECPAHARWRWLRSQPARR
ncbi:hypothetical protein B0T16DRAFT_410613 [Cercophora newfieldiana]|uniref:Uncharacterized protein n=1 Tax=Cercophora newfieldiana TaxID=92897 RepID=A0AA39YDW6_9PEZI|nr:hypothetical protein B0T16DRAFT_410613 [Cercophora newfieldiana]